MESSYSFFAWLFIANLLTYKLKVLTIYLDRLILFVKN